MKLDIGCSSKKLPGYLGMDFIAQDGVDIVHDLEIFPWPVESGSAETINASHVLEHLKPWTLIPVMNECHRVMSPSGQMDIRTPYGEAYAFDPTHCILFQESSFCYFDPQTPWYSIYKPRPWKIISMTRDTANLELRTLLERV